MKKLLFSALFALLSFGFVNAQAIEKGDFILQPDLNLGSWGVAGWSGFGFGATINGEYAVHDYASVGAYIGYSIRSTSGASFHRIGFGARGVFHFWNLIDNKVDKDLKSDKIDFYFPVHLGYHIYKFDGGYYWAGKSGQFRVGAGLGIRYYFKDNFGVNFETGGMEMSWAKIGVNFKF